MWKEPIGYRLNFRWAGLSPTSGRRLMPCRCRQRCRDDRVRCVRQAPWTDGGILPHRRLQGVEAVVQRQQRVTADGDDHRFLVQAENA